MASRTSRMLLSALATPAFLGASPALAAPAPSAVALAWDTDRAATAYAANPAAVTASGSENAGTTPGLAIDGNGATRWSSDFADDAWIRIDLGTTIRVDRVVLDWEAAYGKRYVLEASRNGTDWTPFYTETDGTGGTVTAHTYPQEVTGRYIRLRGVERATPWGYSIWRAGHACPASAPPRPRRGERAGAAGTGRTGRVAARLNRVRGRPRCGLPRSRVDKVASGGWGRRWTGFGWSR